MSSYDSPQYDIRRMLSEQASYLQVKSEGARSSDGLSLASYLWYLTTVPVLINRLLIRFGIWERLVYSFMALGWFKELSSYWTEQLKGRPIWPKDFVFLSGLFRQRFAELGLRDGGTSSAILDTWRDPRHLHTLFMSCHKTALFPILVSSVARYLPSHPRICEFGCGIGPITASLCKYYRHLGFQITGADLPHLMLHFYRWRFRGFPFVHSMEIDPQDAAPLKKDWDAIFCMAVFEHLARPLETAQHLISRLCRGGVLIFDYVASAGTGLDTSAGRDQRIAVLECILDKCRILSGSVPLDGGSVGTVVAKRL